jgi:hypothetical protein
MHPDAFIAIPESPDISSLEAKLPKYLSARKPRYNEADSPKPFPLSLQKCMHDYKGRHLLFALGIRTGCDVNFQFLYKNKSLLHWVTLDCTGLHWITMGCWIALGCTGRFFYTTRLHWVVTSFLWVE